MKSISFHLFKFLIKLSAGVVGILFVVGLIFPNATLAQGSITADFDGNGLVNAMDALKAIAQGGSQIPTNIIKVLAQWGQHGSIVTATPTTGPNPTATPTGSSSPTYSQVLAWVTAYDQTHPGREGDITIKTDAQLATDPDAKRLAEICGPNQKPVIPLLSWEYGGNDHAWINQQASALVYCVYTPVALPTSHWRRIANFDPSTGFGRVVADVYVLFPEQNPCKSEVGRNQVIACLGDYSNHEILVDTASMRDGHDVGLELKDDSTELKLILPDGSKVQLLINL